MDTGNTLDRVVELLRQRGDGELATVRDTDRLTDLGLDSIDLMYVLSSFERSHDADFEDTDFDLGRYRTVADLAALVERRVHG